MGRHSGTGQSTNTGHVGKHRASNGTVSTGTAGVGSPGIIARLKTERILKPRKATKAK